SPGSRRWYVRRTRWRLPSSPPEAARRRATLSCFAGCQREVQLRYLCVHNDRWAGFLDEVDLADPKRAQELLRNHAQWSGRRSIARRRLRVSGRGSRVEGHVALDFLEDLVNVPVEHRHGAKAF